MILIPRVMYQGYNPNNPSNKELQRSLFFFRLSYALSQNLKHIFMPYYSHLLSSFLYFLSSASNNKLMITINEYICLLLNNSFYYDQLMLENDTEQFWTIEHYHTLIEPLCNLYISFYDQCTNEQYHRFITQLFIPCIINMAKNMAKVDLWKILHNTILSYFQYDNIYIKKAAINTITSLFHTCKHDYLSLLPQTIPYLAEVMEDEHDEIEVAIQQLIKQIEDLSGEDIQEYLN